MKKMSNETIALRLKWAEALESGRYGQARFHLRVRTNTITDKVPTYGYCCLGVAIAELGDHSWDQSGNNRALSLNACKLLGLDQPGELDAGDLSDMNDSSTRTFTQIAARIRNATPKPTEEKG